MAISTANKTTIGVQTRANFVINFSVCAFLDEAFSTNSRIRATVDSPATLVTRTLTNAFVLIHPAKISSPTEIRRGIDSPVNADVSK